MWRVKLIWLGLAPVYAIGVVKALAYGPRRRPIYRVTRKTSAVGWYWRETLPQAVLAVLPVAGLIAGIATGRLPSILILVSAGYWGLVSSAALAGFVARGWFGLSAREALRTVERRVGSPSAAGSRRRAALVLEPAGELLAAVAIAPLRLCAAAE